MSTNSTIIYEKPNGTIEYRFNHYDGAVHHTGYSLYKFLGNETHCNDLFNLNRNFETITMSKKEFNELNKKLTKEEFEKYFHQNQYEYHTINNLIIKAQNKTIKKQTLKNGIDMHLEISNDYVYLFTQKNKKWHVSKNQNEFIPLDLIADFSYFSKEFYFLYASVPDEITQKQQQQLEKLANNYFLSLEPLNQSKTIQENKKTEYIDTFTVKNKEMFLPLIKFKKQYDIKQLHNTLQTTLLNKQLEQIPTIIKI